MTVAAVLTAAGSGSRLGSPTPKALVAIGGTPMVRLAASNLAAVAHRIVVTAPADYVEAIRDAVAGVAASVEVVAGGATRQQSVALGLDMLADLDDDAIVLIHDAARPFMPVSVMGSLVDAVEGNAAQDAARVEGAIPVLPVVDTIVRLPGVGAEADAGTEIGPTYLERPMLGAVQTPQAFRLGPIRFAHAAAAAQGFEATDDGALLVWSGGSLGTVPGDSLGAKVTFASDVADAERRLAHADGDRN